MIEALIAGALLAVVAWRSDAAFQRRVRVEADRHYTRILECRTGLAPVIDVTGTAEVTQGRAYTVFVQNGWVHHQYADGGICAVRRVAVG